MTMKRSIRFVLAAVFFTAPFLLAQTLTTAQAKDHIGENATVCGSIASEKTAASGHGSPTFINLDQPYPSQVFTVLIWGSDRATVGTLPKSGQVCAKGTIELYRGNPEIVVRTSANLYVPTLSNNRHYTNSNGDSVHSPAYSSGGPPPGATAQCRDGTYSFSQHRQGTCSHHGGVAHWLP
jgi:hypothetical protein